MPGERMNEIAALPKTWMLAFRNTNMCASLPSEHLPSSTDPRMIRQDPAKDLSLFGTSVSLPFLLLSIYVWFGEEGKVPMPT